MFVRLALAAAFASLFGAASAATLSEANVPGGNFGDLWSRPTEVGAGYDVIEGTGSQNSFDNFVFSLPSGAQRITFDFFAPADIGYSYSAGGEIKVSEAPFRWGWDGRTASTVQIDYNRRTQSYTLDLAPDFGGVLYLALNFTHGADLGYRISVPSNVASAPAPVPLPAGIWLIGAAAAALVGARATRGRAQSSAA